MSVRRTYLVSVRRWWCWYRFNVWWNHCAAERSFSLREKIGYFPEVGHENVDVAHRWLLSMYSILSRREMRTIEKQKNITQ